MRTTRILCLLIEVDGLVASRKSDEVAVGVVPQVFVTVG